MRLKKLLRLTVTGGINVPPQPWQERLPVSDRYPGVVGWAERYPRNVKGSVLNSVDLCLGLSRRRIRVHVVLVLWLLLTAVCPGNLTLSRRGRLFLGRQLVLPYDERVLLDVWPVLPRCRLKVSLLTCVVLRCCPFLAVLRLGREREVFDRFGAPGVRWVLGLLVKVVGEWPAAERPVERLLLLVMNLLWFLLLLALAWWLLPLVVVIIVVAENRKNLSWFFVIKVQYDPMCFMKCFSNCVRMKDLSLGL